MKATNTETTAKVTVTETCLTKLVAKVEMTYVPDHCMMPRTIKAGEVVAEYKGTRHYEPWAFEGNPAENFRVEHFLITRKITTETTVEAVKI